MPKRPGQVINTSVKRQRHDLKFAENSSHAFSNKIDDEHDDASDNEKDKAVGRAKDEVSADESGDDSENGLIRIPNVIFSFPDWMEAFETAYGGLQLDQNNNYRMAYARTLGLKDILDFFSNAHLSFKNMYLFIEYVFVNNPFRLFWPALSASGMANYVNCIVAIKQKHNWKTISKLFVNGILNKLSDGTQKSLLLLIHDNGELTSSDEAAEIICSRGLESKSRSRKHYRYDTIRMIEFISGDVKKYKFFWTHPLHKDHCSKPGRCGFVLRVVPIDKTFDIQLSTRPEDYSEDIHCHPEILDPDNMHLVLRRDFSTKGKSVMDSQRSYPVHISWREKPEYNGKNHVLWSKELIQDSAYIALIVYFSYDPVNKSDYYD